MKSFFNLFKSDNKNKNNNNKTKIIIYHRKKEEDIYMLANKFEVEP